MACALLLAWGGQAYADISAELASPITAAPARYALLTGIGLTGFVMLTKNQISKPFEKETAEDRPLGSYSKYGNIMGQMLPNAVYAGGMTMAQWMGFSHGYQDAYMMVMATAYASVVTTVLKYSIREGRPYDSKVRNSFPSGHSTTAFAFAGVVAAEHGWWYGTPAMALATFVAYSRLNDHQHYLRDVVAGAAVGLSCSLGIVYAQEEERESPNANSFHLVPTAMPDGMQLAASWTF